MITPSNQRLCHSYMPCLPQAAKLLKASILKVDVSDLNMDEDDLAADMAANMAQEDPDFSDMMHQHNVPHEQQAAAAEDVHMADADHEQQENVPPPGGDGNVQQQEKQASQQDKQPQQEQPQQQKRSTNITAEKYEFVKVGIWILKMLKLIAPAELLGFGVGKLLRIQLWPRPRNYVASSLGDGV